MIQKKNFQINPPNPQSSPRHFFLQTLKRNILKRNLFKRNLLKIIRRRIRKRKRRRKNLRKKKKKLWQAPMFQTRRKLEEGRARVQRAEPHLYEFSKSECRVSRSSQPPPRTLSCGTTSTVVVFERKKQLQYCNSQIRLSGHESPNTGQVCLGTG